MKILLSVIIFSLHLVAQAESGDIWTLVSTDDEILTEICYEPEVGDEYISSDNFLYRIVNVVPPNAYAEKSGAVAFSAANLLANEEFQPVLALTKQLGIYCTHSDESFQPSDGFYSTRQRGTIYQIAHHFAESLSTKGIDAIVDDTLHHPHDAGAYRRSRQTAVQLLKGGALDCLIDIHRDGIPDPASYAVTIGAEKASKIRLLVGRGNQNAALNKEFALRIKAIGDHVYPGLIKDIYMGKGTYNQDLLPRSILFECGTYTLNKEYVLTSLPMLADVLNRALYGSISGSAGKKTQDVQSGSKYSSPITEGEPEQPVEESAGIGHGFVYLAILLGTGLAGIAFLSSGSWRRGSEKVGRNLHEMTGGLLGKKPNHDEEHEHS